MCVCGLVAIFLYKKEDCSRIQIMQLHSYETLAI